MNKNILAIDFETISTKSLKDCGSRRYLQDPSTKITLVSLCAFNINELLCLEQKSYEETEDFLIQRTKVIELFRWWNTGCKLTSFFPFKSSYDLLAHNRDFELNAIYNGYRLKDILPLNCTVHDTMLLARRLGLPNSLDKLSALYGIHKKDTRLLNKFSIGLSEHEFLDKIEASPDSYQEFKKYCMYDTISTVNIFMNLFRKYPEVFEESFEDYVLTASDKINDNGIPVDIESMNRSIELLSELSVKTSKECKDTFGILPTQVLKIKELLSSEGLKLDSVDRKTLESFLNNSSNERLKKLARIRLNSSSSSIKKLNKMEYSHIDGRVKGAFQYYKAHTGRWSASLIQPQNMPRGHQDPSFFDRIFFVNEVTEEEVKNNLRGFIKAPEGRTFVVSDYRQIEFRLLLYASKDLENILKVKHGADLYKELASSIYSVSPEEVTKDQRQIGKIVTLGSGYGLGAKGLERILEAYGIKGINCMKAIESFRKKYSKVVSLWKEFDDDSIECLKHFGRKKDYIYLRLPSGRRLYYHNPKRVTEDMGDWVKESYKFYNGEETEFYYGGKFVENYIQGMARDILSIALVRLHLLNLKTILHVHDEIVVEVKNDKSLNDKKSLIEKCMTKTPKWFDNSFDFLLDVETCITNRYTK